MTTRSWTASDLVAATRSDGDHLTRLHESLAAKAEAAGVLDVAYCTVDTPIGPLLLATTDHGLVRVAFQIENFDDVLTSLAGRVSPRILAAPR
ncbi:MAG: cysteine methyltransferase, partial [Actinobacteria bacterium]|nr:cysteine methyltransferase [Actinomycetota bacterium]